MRLEVFQTVARDTGTLVTDMFWHMKFIFRI